jgi:ketosteroid isomerase-like protein
VVVRTACTGTLAEQLVSVPAGATLHARFAAFVTVREGRMVRQESYDRFDPLPSGR